MKKFDYREWLKDQRWIQKRNQILTRDKNTCQFCGTQDRYLHVHHKEYWVGHKPWEYPDGNLVTLCDQCHSIIHSLVNSINDVTVGAIYGREHSDYHNTGIVYAIDGNKNLIYILESDDGATDEHIYDECVTFKDFKKRYDKEPGPHDWNWLFQSWFIHISLNLEKMDFLFRYNFKTILRNNPVLKEILNNKDLYEE